MNTLNKNISRMIGSYPTSYNKLSKYESAIQKEVLAIMLNEMTAQEQVSLFHRLENECNDYFVKAFRRQYSLEKAADITFAEAVYFAVRVCKTVAA